MCSQNEIGFEAFEVLQFFNPTILLVEPHINFCIWVRKLFELITYIVTIEETKRFSRGDLFQLDIVMSKYNNHYYFLLLMSMFSFMAPFCPAVWYENGDVHSEVHLVHTDPCPQQWHACAGPLLWLSSRICLPFSRKSISCKWQYY